MNRSKAEAWKVEDHDLAVPLEEAFLVICKKMPARQMNANDEKYIYVHVYSSHKWLLYTCNVVSTSLFEIKVYDQGFALELQIY